MKRLLLFSLTFCILVILSNHTLAQSPEDSLSSKPALQETSLRDAKFLKLK